MSSTVAITVAGTDVSRSVVYSSASFETHQNAEPGTFEITLKDPLRTLGPFVTGSEVILTVDGDRRFAGYVTQVSRKFAFPADIIPTDSRQWVLRGVDYNILFDKRIVRRPADYLNSLPVFHGNQYDGTLISYHAANYLDLPTGFNSTTYVDNIRYMGGLTVADATLVGIYQQQGSTWRTQMEQFAGWSGAVYYIDPDLKLHFHAIESNTAPVEFSDTPNGTTTIGPRDVSAAENGSGMVNEAFVWGGSEWSAAGVATGVVMGHAINSTSVTAHRLWQGSQTHFGETGFLLQYGVNARATQIVNGSGAQVGFNPGLAYPQWDLSMTWYGHDLPVGANVRAGQLVTTRLSTFGGELNPITLPLRSVRISFPSVDQTGKGTVQYDGQLGLSLDDPTSLWGVIRKLSRQRLLPVASASNTTVPSVYGGFGQFTPTALSSTLYDLPNDFGYVAGTLQVYVAGTLLQRDVDFTETDPPAGTFTLTSAPAGWVWVVVRTI